MNTNETPTPESPEFDPISTPPPLPSPDLTTSSNPTAGKPPSMLKGWKNIIPMPDPNSPELQGPMTAGEKSVLKGCGLILAAPIGLLTLWFISRDLLMGAVFLSVAGGIAYGGIKAKKNKLLSIVGALLAAVVTLAILDPVIPKRGKAVPTMGLSRYEMTKNGLENDFKINKSSNVDGLPRYMGESESGGAILELIGDTEDLTKATLTMIMPRDSSLTVAIHARYALAFLGNVDPSWSFSDRTEWFNESIQKFNGEDGGNEISTVRGKNKITIQDNRPVGLSFWAEPNSQ